MYQHSVEKSSDFINFLENVTTRKILLLLLYIALLFEKIVELYKNMRQIVLNIAWKCIVYIVYDSNVRD